MSLAALVPSRQASANTATTGESLSTVVRNFAVLPPGVLPAPALVDLAAEQYRAAIMDPQVSESFLIWAAQTANFSPTKGTGLELSFTTNPPIVVVVDEKGRRLDTLVSLRVERGDTKVITELVGKGVLDPNSGTFTITDPTTLTLLNGGLYEARGDRLISSEYFLAPASFWWTKNDEILTRHKWDGRLGRWRPIRGSGTRNLGPLSEDLDLGALPTWLHEGEFLPGNSLLESFAVLRLQTPNGVAIAEPPVDGFGGVLIVEDVEAFSFAGTTHAGVIDAAGALRWNPAFLASKGGTPIWFTPLGLEDTGTVGTFGEPLFLAPIPGPLEYPLLRIGSRLWLSARMVPNDTQLATMEILPGQVGISETTGSLRFASQDLDKLDPISPSYDPSFLGELVIYDGLAFGRTPTPLRQAQALVDKNGEPAEVGSELYLPRGNEIAPGNSGSLWVPDDTGTEPILGPLGSRPLGTGLVRGIDGPWSLSLFGVDQALQECRVVDTADDVPRFDFKIPRGTAYLVRSTGRVILGREDTKRFKGQFLRFRQNLVTPCVRLEDARLWSRQRYWFTLTGREELSFAINGAVFLWKAQNNPGGVNTASGGVFSAEQLAQSLAAVVEDFGEVLAIRGHLVLAPVKTNNEYEGEVEISVTQYALGFLPGWKSASFIFDHGASLGLYESVDSAAADVYAEVRVTELVLADPVPASPFVLLQQIPLQDVAGYQPNVFFRLQLGKARRLLQPLIDVLYQFELNRFAFLQTVDTVSILTQTTTTLGLEGQTTRRILEAPGNGLLVSRPGQNFVPMVYGDDYHLITDPGNTLILVHEVGSQVLSSSTGEVEGSFLQDPNEDFEAVVPGMQLQVGNAVYSITSVAVGTLGVDSPFPKSERVSYAIFEAPAEGIMLASQYAVFSPLPEEPFRIRLLSSLGLIEGPLKAVGYNPSRQLSLRFGLPAESGKATIRLIVRRLLGLVGAELFVPLNTHVEALAFHLELDGESYTFADGNLEVVLVATPDLIPNRIEVVQSTGQLNVGVGVFETHPRAQVIYQEDLLPPGALLMGQAELDPISGEIAVSAEDLAIHAGVTTYLVELLRATGGVDVTLNPIQGSLLITNPLLPLQVVEAEYFQAVPGTGELLLVDGIPTRITEFLALRILNEAATPTADPRRWAFNPTKRTVSVLHDVTVRVGSTQCNIGNSLHADIQAQEGFVFFEGEQEPTAQVMVSYFVLEAFGGEQAFTVDLPPVWRPPFNLASNTDRFTLLGNRVPELIPGKLLRVGETPLYIESAVFLEGETTVVFSPRTSLPIGSQNPGADSISALSDLPIRDIESLWIEVPNTFGPVSRGATAIEFQGRLPWIVVGAILEIGGYPNIVATVDVGDTTTIGLTTFLERGFASGEDLVRITRRPVYPPTPVSVLGPGSLDPAASVTVIRLPQDGIGEVLTPGLDYEIEASTGNIQFRVGIPTLTQIYLRHTQLVSLAPEIVDGIIQYPRVALRYAAIQTPTFDATLLATYTFANPDSFLYSTLPLDTFIGEVASSLAASSGLAGGPFLGGVGVVNSSQEGVVGPRGEIQVLEAQDRAARRLLQIYQNTILPFEQIVETMDGRVIGDRDGKFRFFVGYTEGTAPPGYEDPFDGSLATNRIFARIFATYRPDLFLLGTDPVVDPDGAALDGEVLEGPFPDPELLNAWINIQRTLIRNDIDDVVLIGRTRKKVRIGPFRIEAFGRYRRMGEAHALSRLFPELTRSFTQMDPGLGADLEAVPPNPGVYAFRRRLERARFERGVLRLPKRQSTWGTTIGQIENPVLGQIENISSLALAPRLPRARIVRYEPFGFPELDASVVAAGGVPFSTTPRPAMILSLVPLSEFPLDAEGNPDLALLAYLGGPTPDLTTGDPNLFTPPWPVLVPGQVFPKVSLGKPDGSLIDLATLGATNFSFGGQSLSQPQSVYIAEVLLGCLVTFAKGDGSLAPVLLALDEEKILPATVFAGDSLLVTPPNAKILNDVDDPVTQEERDVLVSGLPGFRVGFDVGLDDQDGNLRDTTLPSFFDPSLFGLKEILGQRPPLPLMTVEGGVRFKNTASDPTEIPALLGQALDDSGDVPVPYLSTSNEAQILGIAQKAMDGIVDPDNVAGLAQYPDEVLGNDGQILADLTLDSPPATLLTALDLTPVTTAGIYVPHSGVGDVRPFDLLLVEVGQIFAPGAQGILSVGRAQTHTLEVPRFVAPTLAGDRFRYRFVSAMAYVNQPEIIVPPGLVVRRVGNVTQFDLTAISNQILVWNDGSLLAVGGLNTIINPGGGFAYPNNENTLRIHLWTAARPGFPAAFIQTVLVEIGNGAPSITGDAGVQALTAIPTATHEILGFTTAAPFVTISPVPGPGQIQEDPNIPGQSIALWFTVDIDTATNGNPAGQGASLQGFIAEDRLTFTESLDLRSVLPRDEPPVDGIDVASTLEVFFVQGETSDAVTVNGPTETNDGLAFTFLARQPVHPKVGSFTSGVGTVRVMSWESGNFTDITTTPLIFSAIPSSDANKTEPLCLGTAFADATPNRNNRISSATLSDGALENVQAGDIVVVKQGATGHATTKAGTYLVRHVVIPNVGIVAKSQALVTDSLPSNTGKGFAPITFPTITANNANQSSSFTVSGIQEVQGVPVFPVAGTLYFVLVLDTADPAFLTGNYAVDYAQVDYVLGVFTVDKPTARDFAGNPIFASTLDTIPVGTLVAGFDRVEVRMDQATEAGFPRSLVGYDSGISTAIGFQGITVQSFAASTAYVFGGAPALVIGAPGPDEIGVDVAPIVNNTIFQPADAVVYETVPGVIYLGTVDWTPLHGPALVNALLPGDRLSTLFFSEAGIFLDPSMPRPALPYHNGGNYRVVDAQSSVDPSEIGFRSATTFGEVEPENVAFEVRRIRRFHPVLTKAGEALAPLEKLYKMARATGTSYGPGFVGLANALNPYVLELSYTGYVPRVDAGDLIRVMDGSQVLGTALVEGVTDLATRLWLAAPGLSISPVGRDLQIWLRQAPVPHEQSWEELLELMVDEVLLEREADFDAQTGGMVETEASSVDPRHVRDTNKDLNYQTLGILPGDLVIIDPQGLVHGPNGIPATGQEMGMRPFGDRSVATRTTPTDLGMVPFLAGGPSELDDNRGFYRVSEVTSDGLEVSATTSFSGLTGAQPVVFGSASPYAVLPTISGSTAAFAVPPGGPGAEGQMDLRPTAFAGTLGSPPDSFLGNLFSIAPFAYRVIRPNTIFTEETQELILLMRERTLSMIEAFEAFLQGNKYGSYFVFQRDLHVRDLGSPTIPPDGKGVMSNAFVDSIRGLTAISPFANTSDALSILDRRFWIGDSRLDREIPAFQPGAPSYSTFESNANNPSSPVGEGRPVLPDRVEEVLDVRDQLRQSRWSWILARTQRETGTLPQIDRAQAQLSKRLQEVKAQILRRNAQG